MAVASTAKTYMMTTDRQPHRIWFRSILLFSERNMVYRRMPVEESNAKETRRNNMEATRTDLVWLFWLSNIKEENIIDVIRRDDPVARINSLRGVGVRRVK